jgi:striatin 1/3/4
MRFLQTEWHRHERDRNAWDIERAEMKIKIAKLEGEYRASKKMQDAFSTRIKMLEAALKREREKSKSGSATAETETGAKGSKSTDVSDSATKKGL